MQIDDWEKIVLGIEQAITAHGKSCRNCAHCATRTVIEPICRKVIIPQSGPVSIKVHGFCSNARHAQGICGPTGRMYEQYYAPVTVPDAPRVREED